MFVNLIVGSTIVHMFSALYCGFTRSLKSIYEPAFDRKKDYFKRELLCEFISLFVCCTRLDAILLMTSLSAWVEIDRRQLRTSFEYTDFYIIDSYLPPENFERASEVSLFFDF